MTGPDSEHSQNKTWNHWFHWRSIRVRVLVGFVLLTFITAASISLGISVISYFNGRQQAQEKLESVMSLKEFELKTWFESLENELLIALSSEASPERVNIILDLARSNQYYSWYNEAVRRRMAVLLDQTGQFEEYCLLDQKGQIVFCTSENWQGKDCSTETFFKQGLIKPWVELPFNRSEEAGADCWLTAEEQVSTAIVARPVAGMGDQTLGVIAGRARLQKLYQIISDQTGLGTTGTTFLANPDRMILTTTPDMHFRVLSFASEDQLDSNKLGFSQSISLKANSAGIFNGKSGEMVLGVYHWLPDYQLVIAGEQNMDEVLASIRISLIVSLGIALVALLLAVVTSVFITRSITHPLVQLVDTASKIAGGELDQEAPVLEDDEVGAMARAFNSMTTQLRDLINNLELRVKDRTQAYQNANEALRRRARQLEASAEVGRKITSILNLDDLLAQVVVLIQETFNYSHVRVFLLEDDLLILRAATPETPLSKEPVALKDISLNSEAVKQDHAMVANDVSQDARYKKEDFQPAIRSELAVPLHVGNQVLGTLDMLSSERNAFIDEEIRVIQSLGDQIAIAIENTYLYERSRELAIHEERSRLARDLHDSVLQSLYSLNLLAEGWRRRVRSVEATDVEAYFDRTGEISRQALKEMRLLVYELRPSTLEWEGLAGALKRRLDTVETRAGVAVTLQVDDDVVLPKSVEDSLYHIAQEALNNALKYSGASQVVVSLRVENKMIGNRIEERLVRLQVEDNGQGFDPADPNCRGGMGIANMQQRASKIGGMLEIRSSENKGTCISVVARLLEKEDITTSQLPEEEIP